MPKWSKEWPEKEGLYWFYGYRYGKISVGREVEPELILVKVKKTKTNIIYIADGQFMYKSEVEEPHFQKVILPELPILD